MHRGYIKLWRKITEWEWYKDSNTFSLFLHLLVGANYKPSRFFGHEIKRGDIVTGLFQLFEDTGISIQSIRTSLERLKQTGEITIKTTNRFSIITLCNYEIYQSTEEESNKQLTNDQQTSNKQVTTSKELKNDKNNTIVEKIYALYPSRDQNNENRSTGKCLKDKIKIEKLLNKGIPLEKMISDYVIECSKTKAWLKNFSTYLNQLPEVPEQQALVLPIKKPFQMPEVAL